MAIYRQPGDSLPHFLIGDLQQFDVTRKFTGDIFCIQSFDRRVSLDAIYPTVRGSGWVECQKVWEEWSLNLETFPELASTLFSSFDAEIEGIKSCIAETQIEKVVAARGESFEIDVSASDVWSAFESLHHTHLDAFLFLIYHPVKGCWMGATPELLLNVEQGLGKVMALAGTITQDQLGWTAKEALEQTVTSKFIKEILVKEGIYDAVEGEMGELIMGNIKHLVSEWKFGLALEQCFGLVRQLHPTPAVGGYPQSESCDWLEKNEDFERGLYAGYMGLVSENVASFYVTLRCCKIAKNGYTLYAGCGVNEGSNSVIEWKETAAKMNILGQFMPR